MGDRILRPLSYGDFFDEVFDVYRKNFLLLVGIAGIVLMPVETILYTIAEDWGFWLSSIIITFLTYIVTAATTVAVSEAYLGRSVSILSSFRAIRGRVWSFAGTMLLAGLLIALGFILCVIPGVVFSIWYTFVTQVFILEGLSYSKSLKRSKELVKGNFARVFLVTLLSNLLVLAISFALTLPFQAFPLEARRRVYWLGYGIASGLASSLTIPILVTALVMLYYDIRVRREGFDIEMLAQRVERIAGPLSTAEANSQMVSATQYQQEEGEA